MTMAIPDVTAQLTGNLEAIRQDLRERAFIGDDAELWSYIDSAEKLAGMQAAELASLKGQIDRLARFIIKEIPGEPSKNEGAIECAIRIMKTAKKEKAKLAGKFWKTKPAFWDKWTIERQLGYKAALSDLGIEPESGI